MKFMMDKVKQVLATIAIVVCSGLTLLVIGVVMFGGNDERTVAREFVAPTGKVATPMPKAIALVATPTAQAPGVKGLTGGTITLPNTSAERANELVEMFGCEWIIDEMPSQESIDLWGLGFAAQSVATSMQLLLYQHGVNSNGEPVLAYISDADAKQVILICLGDVSATREFKASTPKAATPVATPFAVTAYASVRDVEVAIRDAYRKAQEASQGDDENAAILALSDAEDFELDAWKAWGFIPPYMFGWQEWDADEALINGFRCDRILNVYADLGESVSELERGWQELAGPFVEFTTNDVKDVVAYCQESGERQVQ